MQRHFLPAPVLLLAIFLSAGCSPSPRLMLEEYLQGKTPEAASTTGTSDCPEFLADWLDEPPAAERSWKGSAAIQVLARYIVDEEALTMLELPPVPDGYSAWQQDTALHQELWNRITILLPSEYRREVTRFVLFTDGPAAAVGAVEPASKPGEWMIELDIQDASDLPGFATTLIHEAAHLVSLDSKQVIPWLPLLAAPQDTSLDAQGEAACDTYFLPEGCSLPDSYLNLFFDTFWVGNQEEWLEIRAEADPDTRQYKLARFHARHADEFVSLYAATNPEEDLAESFLHFVLSTEPTGESLADGKVLFFQQFPALNNLRGQMRDNLCTLMKP